MFLIVATLGEARYFYGPYPTYEVAEAVIEQAEARKGDRAPEMTIRPLQNSDAFLVGSDARNYQNGLWFTRA